MIYLWLENTKKMLEFETNEDFENMLDNLDKDSIDEIRNQHGVRIMSTDTKIWS